MWGIGDCIVPRNLSFVCILSASDRTEFVARDSRSVSQPRHGPAVSLEMVGWVESDCTGNLSD